MRFQWFHLYNLLLSITLFGHLSLILIKPLNSTDISLHELFSVGVFGSHVQSRVTSDDLNRGRHFLWIGNIRLGDSLRQLVTFFPPYYTVDRM